MLTPHPPAFPMKRRARPGPEHKQKNIDFTAEFINPGGSLQGLLEIPQGAEQGQRVGNHVQVRRIQVRGHIDPWVAATPKASMAGARCRMVLAVDTQANSSLPTVAELFYGPNLDSFYLPEAQTRFRILNDQTWDFNYLTASVLAAEPAPEIIAGGLRTTFAYDHIVDFPVLYPQGTVQVPNPLPATNNLCMFLIADSDTVHNSVVQATVHLTYTDS